MNGKRIDLLICGGAACLSSHSQELKAKLTQVIDANGLTDEINIVETGCMGPCELGPVMVVYPDGIFYIQLTEGDVEHIVEEHFLKGRPYREKMWQTPEARRIVEVKKQIPFFEKQKKIVLSNCGLIDPEDIDEYIAQGGYEALGKALTQMSQDELIEEMVRSGLRGRGGAGFPTGLKWKFTKVNQSDVKYIICNADEGDPGAFMDRAVLEGDPHSVLEGMAIAGYAIGASRGYIYVRAEYPLAIERVKTAIKQAKDLGVLGKNIFETDFSFEVEIRVGAGAFVCGEETALIASTEGLRGMPRPKPPFPAKVGLWKKPTVINNVETLSNIRHIVLNGADWFAGIGTEKSKGTKVFALSGNVRNTGLVEVPMGITLGELVFEIGGGIPRDKKFKAVQTGGPSGGCIPARFLNTSIDYESLKELGSIMGSGGLIVLDEDICMVNMSKYFLEFSMEESCGQCAPCRIGLKQMYKLLDEITRGKGTMAHLEALESLGKTIKATSLCGLGQAAPNPVLATLKYFRHEYVEHILEKKCSAGVCAALFNAPCQNACPAGVDAASYVSYMGDGKYREAYYTHMENNPFPMACARVCPAFCEQKCSRAKYDEAIAIREVKRLFADWAIEQKLGFSPPEKPHPEKIAIVGGGPSGLACGFYLTRLGYRPTVFEASSAAGGMMKWGIPDYRLPKDKLQAEIDTIQNAGVDIRLKSKIKSIAELREQGFDAIYIATGAHIPMKLGVPGSDLKGVDYGIDFLRKVNNHEDIKTGDHVVVVGGGSTAMDAARAAKRLGARDVRVIYRRTRAEMPALPEELVEAEEEGIQIDYLVNPVAVKGSKNVQAITCVRTTLGSFDDSGRRRPVPLKDSEFEIKADLVIPCLGQKMSGGLKFENVELNKQGFLNVDPRTMKTSADGIFGGGDNVNPSTIIECVAQGRIAAQQIDRYFNRAGKLFDKQRKVVEVAYDEEAYLKTLNRKLPRAESVEKRLQKMDIEVNLGLSRQDCIEEARRCLHCDRVAAAEEKKVKTRSVSLEEML